MLCQQALEKALKAILQSGSPEPPPRTHNLPRLLALTGLMQVMPEAMVDTLVEVDPYIIEARYPATIAPLPPDEILAVELLQRAEEAMEWLLHRLK
jgi:HEPN domain-containing protein